MFFSKNLFNTHEYSQFFHNTFAKVIIITNFIKKEHFILLTKETLLYYNLNLN